MEWRGFRRGTGGVGPGRREAGRREGGGGEAGRIAWRITLSLTDGDALTVLCRGVGIGGGGGQCKKNLFEKGHLKNAPPPHTHLIPSYPALPI